MTLKLYDANKYGETQAGVHPLDDGSFRAYLVMARIGDKHVVMESDGPQEILAIERLLKKAQALSTVWSLQLTENLGPAIHRYETEATNEMMKAMGGGFTSFGGGKKSEPS